MAARPRGPGADAVVGTDEAVAGQHCVVAVGATADQLAVDVGAAPVAAPVMGAQRVAEGARRRGEERRGERARGAFCKEGDASLEAEREGLAASSSRLGG